MFGLFVKEDSARKEFPAEIKQEAKNETAVSVLVLRIEDLVRLWLVIWEMF